MNGDASYVLGMGANSAADAHDAFALAQAVLAEAGIEALSLIALATLDRRADHPGLVAVAERLGVPLRGVSGPALAAESERLATPSEGVAALAGMPGVAEAAALVVAGEGARLVVAKRVGNGLTAALALSAP